jgi:hypothetical protein
MNVTILDIDLDYNKLLEEYERLDINNLLLGNIGNKPKTAPNQIAIQCRPQCPIEDQLYQGVGSLMYDWDNLDENGNPEILTERFKQYEFTEISEYFKGSYFEEVTDVVNEKYIIRRTRFMLSKPKTCLSTHTDATRRIHIPIDTNDNCYMVLTDKVYRLPFGNVYLTDTTEPHTAVNASTRNRTHIVMCIHEKPKYN